MKYFTLQELIVSDTAKKRGIANVPTGEQEANLHMLVAWVLDPAREALGKPIRVTSGFRSAALNKAVKGSQTSQHMKGQAADLRCSDNAKLFGIIRKQGNFDQLIWEFGDHEQPQWVHVSYNAKHNRGEILRAVVDFNGKTKYIRL